MRAYGLVLPVLAIALARPDVDAQERSSGRGLLAVGLGFANVEMIVGGRSGDRSGPTAHGRLGFAATRRSMFVLDAEVQPFAVPNPVRAEAFRAAYVGAAFQGYFGPRVYGRVSAGIQFRRWSGADPVTGSDAGMAFGAALGAELPLQGRLVLAPEAVLYWALIEAEGSVTATLVGARLGVGWRR